MDEPWKDPVKVAELVGKGMTPMVARESLFRAVRPEPKRDHDANLELVHKVARAFVKALGDRAHGLTPAEKIELLNVVYERHREPELWDEWNKDRREAMRWGMEP